MLPYEVVQIILLRAIFAGIQRFQKVIPESDDGNKAIVCLLLGKRYHVPTLQGCHSTQ